MSNPETPLWRALASAISAQHTSLAEFEPDEVVRTTDMHGVVQLLNTQIHAGTVTGVDDATTKTLKTLAYPHVAQDMVLNMATQKVLDLLSTNGIPALLLKGTPVAHLYYPDSYLRTRCDSDIYLDENQVENTAELLQAHGYKLSGLGEREHSSKQFVAAIETADQNYLHFDMHFKLSNRVMFRNTLPFEECLTTSQPVPQLGLNAHTLSKTGLMTHACIHRIAHGRNTQRDRLIWLFDIHLIAKSMNEAELELLLAKAKEKAVGSLCADALEVCQAVFNTVLPPDYLSGLKENSRREPSAKLVDASKLRWAWADMQSLESVSGKLAFAGELLLGRWKL